MSFALASSDTGDGAVNDGQPAGASPRSPEVLHYFGDYELLEEIARGGMGVVYLARQVTLNRTVALKMLLSGPFSSDIFKQRFQAEAEAVGRLQHPNIVSIHEVGEHDGHPYFSMDFVDGPTLAQMTRSSPLPGRMAARYLKKIAEAIHYAHEQGILHRDLKPSNVLVNRLDEPCVTDFGLAKKFLDDPAASSQTTMTLSAHTLGSPGYLPPEQAAPQHGGISRRSDVYGLGATLYHLLTGRPPFAGETVAQTLAQVLETDPPGLHLLNASIPRDLETICLKCLEKQPGKRYATAQLLAEDLGRFLEDRPIEARPTSTTEKAWKWCRRNPMVAGASTAFLLAVVMGVGGISWQWRRAEGERTRALAESLTARRNQYTADLLQAQQALAENDYARGWGLLEEHRPRRGGPTNTSIDLRGWEWGYLRDLCRDDPHFILGAHSNAVRTLGMFSDGRTLFSGGWDQKLKLWDMPSRTCLGELPHALPVWGAAVSPDNRWLVSIALDLAEGPGHGVHVWDLKTRQERPLICTNLWGRPGQSVTISPDSKKVATLNHGTVRVAELPTGEQVADLTADSLRLGAQGVVWSPDGRALIYGEDGRGEIVVVETELWTEIARLKGHRRVVNALAISPDGRQLASISQDRSIRLWNLTDFRLLAIRENLADDGWTLAFSPDGTTIAYGMNSAVHVVRAADLEPVITLRWIPGRVHALAYLTPQQVVVGGGGGEIKVFDLKSPRAEGHSVRHSVPLGENICYGHSSGPFGVFSPTRGHYLTVFTNRTFSIFEVATLKERGPLPLPIDRFSSAALATGGELIAFADQQGRVSFWHTDSTELRSFAKPGQHGYVTMQFSQDNALLAFTDYHGFQIYDVRTATRTQLARSPYKAFLFNFRFTPDSKRVIGSTDIGEQIVWALDHIDTPLRLPGVIHQTLSADFTPDGQTWIASHGETRFWDIHTGRLKHVLGPAFGMAGCAAVSPDGSRLALGMTDGNISLLDMKTLREVARFQAFDLRIGRLTFSPDGGTLFAATVEGMKIWKTAPAWRSSE